MRNVTHKPYTTKNMKALLVSFLLVAVAFVNGCSRPESAAAAKIDKNGDEIMASSTRAEARQWMKQPKHVFFKADPKEVAKFIEDFYQAGAVQVYIADIEEFQGYQYGESLLVVLPKDASARAKLFQIGARAETAFQNDPRTDVGQKYLYYQF